MAIQFKDVVAIAGQPGLYHVIKTDDKSVIVESLDERRKRQLVRGNMMVSKLADITMYTEDDSEPLLNILKAIGDKFGAELPVHKDSDNASLLNFLAEVLPNFNREKVYASNVKKLLAWYQVLHAEGIAFELPESEPAPESEAEAGSAGEPATDPAEN